MLSSLNPVKSDLLSLHNFLQNELKHIFEPETRMGSLPVNILETEDRFLIELVAPGFEKNDFSVELEKELLTIRAEHQEEKQEQNAKFHTRQYAIQSFSRSFRITDSVDANGISASYESGILTISLPKKKEYITEPKKLIEIQ
jgi:HSP20 family protein